MSQPVLADFARHIAEIHGEQGAAWLAGLPARIEVCSQRQGQTVLRLIGRVFGRIKLNLHH